MTFGCQAPIHVNPGAPVGPCGPAGPGSPCGPAGPIAPGAPGAPSVPRGPAGPGTPSAPRGPAGPTSVDELGCTVTTSESVATPEDPVAVNVNSWKPTDSVTSALGVVETTEPCSDHAYVSGTRFGFDTSATTVTGAVPLDPAATTRSSPALTVTPKADVIVKNVR